MQNEEPGEDRDELDPAHPLTAPAAPASAAAKSSLAGNAVIEAMMESLRLSISDYVAESIRSDEAWEPVADVLRGQHHGILAAVSAGEGKRASQLLREHIEWFYAETQR